MRLDGLPALNIVEIAQPTEVADVFRSSRGFACHVDDVVREAWIEVIAFLNFRDILRTELQAKSFDIGLEMSYFAAADKRILVGRL